jgi:FixJ family two-component response regulator
MAKILVIDDEQGMRQVTAKIMAQQGYEVFQAEDGATALKLLASESPDLVLLDIRLPDMDGVEILANVRRTRPDLPVIMLSGFGDIETAVDLVRQGAYDYISKPYKVDKLLSLARNALNQNEITSSDDTVPAETPKLQKSSSPSPAKEPVKVKGGDFEIKNSWIFASAGLVILLAAGFFSYKYIVNRALPDQEFQVPYSNPSAICAYKDNIWVSDIMEETIYKHAQDEKFSVIAAYKLTGIQINGVACDGKNLWTCNSFEQKIHKHKLDYNLSIEASYNAPNMSISGLYIDGKDMWSMNFQQGKINKHKIEDLSILNTYNSPAPNPCGMFKKDKSFYIADAGTNKIYKVRENDFSVEGVFILDKYKDGRLHIAGLSFDGKNIWSVANGIPIVFRHPFKSLKLTN